MASLEADVTSKLSNALEHVDELRSSPSLVVTASMIYPTLQAIIDQIVAVAKAVDAMHAG
jgi:hypothetical protein